MEFAERTFSFKELKDENERGGPSVGREKELNGGGYGMDCWLLLKKVPAPKLPCRLVELN